ncbi:TIGR03546 family protein [Aliikangiella marina]|uniref:TIGR03546 family protein n=1 Tax=Aliikangiella marina TaxID=1712262 RepID=A0A545T4K4_9GAMM|nr:TIGR03546 family protein [Aliikangiella marina]TQV72112.1 TIGR03546 family protein [Aliikangiella marina]
MLSILAKLLKVLNSEQSPGQIAAAISLAAIVGFTPLFSLHNIVIFFFVLILRVNLTVFLVAWPLLTLLGVLIAPGAESIGLSILQNPSLIPFWESFYNTLIGRWSNFYFSGVIGGLVIGVITAVVLYPVSILLVNQYRTKLMQRFEQFHIVRLIKTTKFWQLYDSTAN